tara:strand:- start:409 stop:885 length:477 start_codon:yes stop_codon:yes gene_type:complete
MAHFAQIVDNIVVNVIVAEQSFINNYTKKNDSEWIQTSYNTFGGKHYDPETGLEDDGVPLRYNYAGIGFTYDRENDAFIPQIPYDNFVLNTETFRWEPPIPYPTGFDGGLKRFIWDDDYSDEYRWRDTWQNELSYYNPEHRYYDPTVPQDFSDSPWVW